MTPIGIRAAPAGKSTQPAALSLAAPGESTSRACHPFRHPFATRLLQAAVPIAKLPAWLGHSDIRTTMMYPHPAPGHEEDIEKA